MTTYKICRDGFKFQELDLEINDIIESFPEEYDYNQVHEFSVENIAMKSFWPKFQTGWSTIEGRENLIPDVTTWIDATLVLSPKAFRFLGDSLSQYGELLPFHINGEVFYIFNCLTIAEINEAKSSETHIEFSPSSIEDKLVFKTPSYKCIDLYCHERLKELTESFELSGIVFDKHLGTFKND